ncbi:Ger(x)C family spore germination protein [Neobacillus sp. PS3-12]|jgi:spore germination protein KC|uniref:Ger(x)C family spore germination protein n=1 Tax=Neobacillus sp. PS3-12 TaxID=3070677 RepID=UPI0027DFC9CF|nr:Ger(x)C family spore germination protein [Neobacillus sp. PS3-12]WML54534.1 Ger(x)C family spore germination protein [Neobacillus sp. PS3-12]
MKTLPLVLITLILIPILTGCWNRRELNELALVVAMSIDKSGNQYSISTQVVDPGEVSVSARGGGRAPVTTYDEKGKHLFEAVRRMTTVSPRKLYWSHLQMLVISEEVAKDGLNNILDFFTRDNEFRKDFYIVVSKNIQAKEILRNLTSIEKIPAHKMRSSLETSERAWAPTVAIQLDELIAALTSDGINPVLTGITIHGNGPKGESVENVQRIQPFARLKYKNIAVFKKDNLIGWLNENESKGYNYIMNNVRSTVGHIPCEKKGELVVEIIRSKTKIKGKVVNGKPKIDISLSSEANIGEVSCHVDLTKPDAITQLEKNTDKVNVDTVKNSINKAKELGVDVFGFGEVIHRADPKAWKSLKNNWDKEFVKVPVTIHSEFKIRRTGAVNQSFLQQEKE